jgi:hypothetical protein
VILRLLTLIIVFLHVGVPYISSSTNPALVKVYQANINWGSHWAQGLWILWALWMLWPVVNFFRVSVKYPF